MMVNDFSRQDLITGSIFMYDSQLLFEEYMEGREAKDYSIEDNTSRDDVLAQFIKTANDNIKYHGIPASEEEFEFFVDLTQDQIFNLNFDPSVFTDEEWVAIAKDIIAKAK